MCARAGGAGGRAGVGEAHPDGLQRLGPAHAQRGVRRHNAQPVVEGSQRLAPAAALLRRQPRSETRAAAATALISEILISASSSWWPRGCPADVICQAGHGGQATGTDTGHGHRTSAHCSAAARMGAGALGGRAELSARVHMQSRQQNTRGRRAEAPRLGRPSVCSPTQAALRIGRAPEFRRVRRASEQRVTVGTGLRGPCCGN